MRNIRLALAVMGLAGLGLMGSCAHQAVRPDIPGHHGVVYYLDGAGGGSLITDWGRGVKSGLFKGGYAGEYHEFRWQTGFGVLADQTSSSDYKRSKARELAKIIVAYAESHPGEPINLIGLSAGTAVAVYTLEALPKWCTVDTVVLLGSSVDADYNLCSALLRVEDNIVVFTSSRDGVLGLLVPMAGSADREYVGNNVAGIMGFRMPRYAGEQTRQLYAKVKRIPWNPKFAQYGDHGNHTGATQPRFVQNYIAPLVIPAGVKVRMEEEARANNFLSEDVY